MMVWVKAEFKVMKEVLLPDLSEHLTSKSERAKGWSFQKQAEVADQLSGEDFHD